MQSINMRSHVGHDGVLKLEVPVEVHDTDLDVTVIVQPVSSSQDASTANGWPPGFLDQIAGAWQGEPLYS